MKKIRVGAVSYLNTKPLLYGIERSAALKDKIEIVTDYPSRIAADLLSNKIDIGLVPVAIIPEMNEWHIYTDYCIGADGDVASVCLFSETEIKKVDKVLMDYQSRTSVQLGKILLKHHWQVKPELVKATGEFADKINGTTAGIIIGDRAFKQRKKSSFIYDLAGEWQKFTGLPFVFAAWIANKELPQDFIDDFNEANSVGLTNLDKVLEQYSFEDYDLYTYYTQNISYQLTPEKMQGLKMFLNYIKSSIPEAANG